jgi:hypothetical protein
LVEDAVGGLNLRKKKQAMMKGERRRGNRKQTMARPESIM